MIYDDYNLAVLKVEKSNMVRGCYDLHGLSSIAQEYEVGRKLFGCYLPTNVAFNMGTGSIKELLFVDKRIDFGQSSSIPLFEVTEYDVKILTEICIDEALPIIHTGSQYGSNDFPVLVISNIDNFLSNGINGLKELGKIICDRAELTEEPFIINVGVDSTDNFMCLNKGKTFDECDPAKVIAPLVFYHIAYKGYIGNYIDYYFDNNFNEDKFALFKRNRCSMEELCG